MYVPALSEHPSGCFLKHVACYMIHKPELDALVYVGCMCVNIYYTCHSSLSFLLSPLAQCDLHLSKVSLRNIHKEEKKPEGEIKEKSQSHKREEKKKISKQANTQQRVEKENTTTSFESFYKWCVNHRKVRTERRRIRLRGGRKGSKGGQGM